MYSNGDSSSPEDSNGESNEKAQRSIRGINFSHVSDLVLQFVMRFGQFHVIQKLFVAQKVAKTKEMLSKQAVQTKQILSKHADKIAKRAEEHERFINKVIK